jgi:hypothetical protein
MFACDFPDFRFQTPSTRIDKELDKFSLAESRWAATGLPDASATLGLFGVRQRSELLSDHLSC